MMTKQQVQIKKIEAGRAAISSMKSGVKIISFTQRILDLDQTIELSTNIWSDSIFRNTWNKVEDWGTVVGIIIASGGVLSSNEEDTQNGSIAEGLGVVGVSKLLGNLLGINEKKFREKMERIDLSVRAYDDLKMRSKQLQLFLSSNIEFEKRVISFELEYTQAKPESVSILMAKLLDLLDDYKLILKQIPDYLDNITTVSVGYVNDPEKYKNLPMTKIFDKILTKCNDVKDEYNKEVKPLLIVSPELTQAVLGLN